MNFIRLTIFVIILSLIEVLFVPIPLVFIWLLLWLQFKSEKEAFILAFIAGFLFDIFFIRTLGTTSLIFTSILFVMILYKRKFDPHNSVFLGIATFASTLVISLSASGVFDILLNAVYTIMTVILSRLIFPTYTQYESWSRVS